MNFKETADVIIKAYELLVEDGGVSDDLARYLPCVESSESMLVLKGYLSDKAIDIYPDGSVFVGFVDGKSASLSFSEFLKCNGYKLITEGVVEYD